MISGSGGKMPMRTRIVEAAIAEFAKRGYSGARTAEIAREAGCAEGTVFRYFPKKIDLLQHVAEQFIIRFAGQVVTQSLYEILNSSEAMSPVELMEAVMRDRVRLIQANSELLKIVIYEVNFHPEVRTLFVENFMNNLGAIGEELASTLRVKLDRPDLDTQTVVRTVLGMIGGVFIQGHLMGTWPEDAHLDKVIAESAVIVIDGLKGA